MTLFQCKRFTSHSGLELNFKIDCDYLSNDDIECIARLIAKKTKFGHVYGIPRGGERLAEALKPYSNPHLNALLIVDDVLTTGRSMEEARERFEADYWDIIGWVIFARVNPPEWVNAVFILNEEVDKPRYRKRGVKDTNLEDPWMRILTGWDMQRVWIKR